jgi:hypothetical protein
MAGRFQDHAIRASQRRAPRVRAQPPASALPTPGATVRWRGRTGTVDRIVNPIHAMVDFNGKKWLVPVTELAL